MPDSVVLPATLQTALQTAEQLLWDRALVRYHDQWAGAIAALPEDQELAAANYREIFIRDNVPVMLYLLLQGKTDVVRDFLQLSLSLQSQALQTYGILPTSFVCEETHCVADYGQRAIGRVVSADPSLWWPVLLQAYRRASHDDAFVHSPTVQQGLQRLLAFLLRPVFNQNPLLEVPDGAFMVGRPLDVAGAPLEIQVLLYGALRACGQLLQYTEAANAAHVQARRLRQYLCWHYWVTPDRLRRWQQWPTEEFGDRSHNPYNIQPIAIPDWVEPWLGESGGYFLGNIRAGRPDFRFFSLGNLLAIVFDVLPLNQQGAILRLILQNEAQILGQVPLRLCYPALTGSAWKILTGCDPKNQPWSYHNGGSWPSLLWYLSAAVLHYQQRGGDRNLCQVWLNKLQHYHTQQCEQLPGDEWPEYYEGQDSVQIATRACRYQTWTFTGLLLNHALLSQPQGIQLLSLRGLP
ncbi:putative neutral invertase [Synechococcus elongatus PCC 6301]|uniref:beta-fructofuranosidase n=1 Tax=Synechococcus sp. (strain ATCC 27144 / PCC 6301 / SAUG 1402/1) TaxID=269084 RepID=A0A0H3K264_SYNP6|nr:glycoside hydrolase 100 family protein [Synechococcus elongatus]BAD79308.1 putative neutral invertase [Synechococcus elongatus PCC 6301]